MLSTLIYYVVGDPQPCPAIGLNQAGSIKDLLRTKSFEPQVLKKNETRKRQSGTSSELSKPVESVDRLKNEKRRKGE
jgi:hypothetical protein